MATINWGGTSGDWTDAADWSGGTAPGGGDAAVISSGTVTIGSADEPAITVGSISINAPGTLAIADPGETQTVTGNVTNTGILDVDATGAGGSTLDVEGTLNNTGSGTDGVFIGNATIAAATAVSVAGLSNTGRITLAGGSASAMATLTVTGEATLGGTITMNSFADLAGDSALILQAATINGGILTDASGVSDNAFGATLNGVTIASGTTYTVSNGSQTILSGDIVNDGEIFVDASSSTATLSIAAAGATLAGSGTVLLTSTTNNLITGSGGAKLVNAGDTIEGSGQIEGLTAFDNQAGSTIDADQSANLLIYGIPTLTNEGVVEATNGAILVLQDGIILTQNQGGADGTIEASGANSTVELSGATVVGGTLMTASGGVIESFGGNGATLSGVTIASGSTYTDSNGSSTTLEGTIVNDGEILVDSTGAGSSLIVNASGATLTGGGAVVLSTGIDNAIAGTGSAPLLTNVNNTISGAGQITGLSFDNQAAGVVDADDTGATLLFFEEQGASVLTNEGTYEATNGGTLNLDATVLTQNHGGADGTIEASGANSTVELSGATVVGGTLTTASGGVIESFGGNGATLKDLTIASGSTYTDSNGSSATIEGTIVNDGEILVDSTGGGADLIINSVGATLTGSGTVILAADAVNSEIATTGSGPQLINAGNTIEGAGQIQGLTTFTNQSGGTVDADDQSQTLLIDPITTLTNAGVFEATNGGILHVLPAIAGAGQLLIQAGSEIDLGGATSETATFIGANGELKLDTPSNYTGTIVGFAVGDTFDLGSTTATTATPTADGANTTLTVNLSGGGSLTYTLAGDYTADTFTVTKSGSDSLITVSASNAPPVVNNAGNTVGYIQGGPAAAVDSGLSVTDTANPIATTATVQIGAGFVSGDQLTFAAEAGITGNYDPTSGILSLSGSAAVGTYETLLDSVTFSSISPNPTNSGVDPTRTVTWIVGNGAVNSAPVTSTVDVTALPVLGGAGNTTSYAAGGAAAPIDNTLTVSDFSSSTLTGATVTDDGFQNGDVLNATNLDGGAITENYNSATGILTLSGAANLSAYQAALDSITYSSTAVDPTNGGADFTRTISWVASSGAENSAAVTSTIDVAAPPELTGAGNTAIYTQGEGPIVIDSNLAASDASSAALSGATVAISGALAGDVLNATNLDGGLITESYADGVLTLAGTVDVAAYTAALDSITYSSTATDPTSGGADPTRTVTWAVNNGTLSSAPVTSTIDVTLLPPVLQAGSTAVTYTPGGAAVAVDSGLLVSDVSSPTLSGATASIGGGFLAGDQLNFATENGITGGYNPATGELVFSGTASLTSYQAELDSVTYSSTAADPTDNGTDPTRTITWVANSGIEQSALASNTVDVTAPPVLQAGNVANYTVGGSAVPVDAGLTVGDVSSGTLDSATVTISGGPLAGDVLTLGAPNGLASSFSGNVLTLSGTASLAAYEAALDSIAYSSTATDPTAGGTDPTRTITWVATSGAESSAPVTSTIDLVVAPPVLSNAGNTASYTEAGATAVVDETLEITDQSSGTLTGATVTDSGFFAGDQLNFVSQGGITGQFTGNTLTLSGTASLAAYQAALESITFSTTGNNPTDFGLDPTRTIVWQVTSNGLVSNTASSTVDVTGVDQPPTLSNAGNTVTFTLGGAAQPVDPGLLVSDPDSLDMGEATVVIGDVVAGDTLTAANLDGNKITASYTAATGTLTLSGIDTIGAYQTALDSVVFSTTNTNTTARTVSWQINDGSLNSNTVNSTVQIGILAPVVSGGGNSVTYTAGGTAVVVDPALTVVDQGSTTLTEATASIGAGFVAGDVLNATNLDGGLITESYSGGVLTLSGAATIAAYQAALDSVTFSSTAANPSTSTRQINFQVDDQIPSGPNETSNIVSSSVTLSASQVITWINAKGGSFNVTANWSPATIPGLANEAILASTSTGTGSAPPPNPTYTVTNSQNNTLGMLELFDPRATLNITNRSTFTLGSTPQSSVNDGTIAIVNGSTLNLTGTLNNQNAIESTGASAQPSILENGTVDNSGLVEATGGSTLLLQNTTIDNLFPTAAHPGGGEIQDAKSTIELDNATVIGGSLVTTEQAAGWFGEEYTGLIDTAASSQSNLLNGTAVNALLNVSNNSSLTLEGPIDNSGEITIESTGQPTALKIDGNVSLSGGGFVVIGNELSTQIVPNSIVGASAGATLTNVNDDIQGVGTIGNSQLTLVNEGTILAASLVGEALTINTGTNPITNSGNLVSDSDLIVDSPVVGTGSVQINFFDTVEFGSSVSSGQTVDFENSIHGVLKLDHAENFNGTVVGLSDTNNNVFDTIDLADFRFADTKITSVTGTGAKGTTTNVTFTDSVDHLSETLHLLNQFANQYAVSANDYSLTSDNPHSAAAGTLFSVDHMLGAPNVGVG